MPADPSAFEVLGIVIMGAALLAQLDWWPFSAHRAYVDGNEVALRSRIRFADAETAIPLWVALGEYERALSIAAERSRVLDPAFEPDGASLDHVNAAEALVELGRLDEAEKLLRADGPAELNYVRSARLTSLAWTLTVQGRHDEAMLAIDVVQPDALGREYAAEPHLARALIHLNRGSPREAELALAQARRATVRASTERNILLFEARLALERGDLEHARLRLTQAREHRWQRQGGAAYLALGAGFERNGDEATARECWLLAAERDPQSEAARSATRRLAEVERSGA